MEELTIAQALKAVDAGLEVVRQANEPSALAVVDAGGNLLAFARSDGASFGVSDVARAKAYTAAAFRCRTSELAALAQPGGECFGLETAGGTQPYVLFGGGVPVVRGNQFIGAVGVSGGPVVTDERIAVAMVAVLQAVPSVSASG